MTSSNKIETRIASTPGELKAAYKIRREVFVIEQKIFPRSDRDKLDEKATHLIAADGDLIVGTVRIADMGSHQFNGSRLAVKTEKRGGVAGKLLVENACELAADMGAHSFSAHIQTNTVPFFKKLGWIQARKIPDYHGKPHVLMTADMDKTLLKLIARKISTSRELVRKSELGKIWKSFSGSTRSVTLSPLEDAGVIQWEGSNLLISSDGIQESLIKLLPYLAGRAAAIACLNDILAMGGKPLAMVDVLSVISGKSYTEITRGMKDEAARYGVKIIGGHFHPDASAFSLSASAIGTARHPVLSSTAKPGMALVAIIDRRGKRWNDDMLNWDSNASKSCQKLAQDHKLLTNLSEGKAFKALKDISNAGIIGTTVMMCRASGVGAEIDLGEIEPPDGLLFSEWVRMFMSYGFIAAVNTNKVGKILKTFSKKGIWSRRIGKIITQRKLFLTKGSQRILVSGIKL